MADRLVFIAWAVATLLAPLAWRLWRDRLAARALLIHARMSAALERALGGQSFVAVEVVAATAWRRGRVILGVPPGWDHLVKAAWDGIVESVPSDYDLVVRGAHRGTKTGG